MGRFLVIYSSIDGQTARIAERVALMAAQAGHDAAVLEADAGGLDAAIRDADAVVIGAAIRYGHYSRTLENLVRAHHGAIAARPNAFFSVCLSAGGPGARPATAWGYVDDFIVRTGWQPARIASFAGALRYSRYNPFIKFMMRLIVGAAGGETDPSHDYEYTDWAAVERFGAELAARLQARQPAQALTEEP